MGLVFLNKNWNWEVRYNFYRKSFLGGSFLKHFTFLKTTPHPRDVINDRSQKINKKNNSSQRDLGPPVPHIVLKQVNFKARLYDLKDRLVISQS